MTTQHTPTPWELWQCGNEWMLTSVRHGKLVILQATRDGMQGATFRVRDHKTCVMHKVTESDVQEHPDLLFLLRACNSHDDLLAACENTATSLAICQMPRLDDTVADNDQIIAIALDGLRAAIAKAKGPQ